MIEIPESINLAKQLDETVRDKTIKSVCANHSPHSFAWYFGNPEKYNALLAGKTLGDSIGIGSMVEISVEDSKILLNDGINIRYITDKDKIPEKHQLLIEFDDKSYIVCTVQMYGGMMAFKDGQNDNDYYYVAKKKPLPTTDEFSAEYFNSLMDDEAAKMSSKAFLATKQRIPGLGNGILQDILYNARIHPKTKMNTLSDKDYEALYLSIKSTIKEMIEGGGRDTEKDIFGRKGGYKTKLSKNTLGKICWECGSEIKKAAYLGGTIYFCENCQK